MTDVLRNLHFLSLDFLENTDDRREALISARLENPDSVIKK